MFNFNAVLDVRELMKMLYGAQVPDRTLNFQSAISLGNYGRLDTLFEATHVLPGDREHDWLFDATIVCFNQDTYTLPPVPHGFQDGQRVRGVLSLNENGPHAGLLYVVKPSR